MPSGLAINQRIYLNKCIKERLILFIDKYHSDGAYVFWANLASSHYAKTVITYLNKKKVHFVEKADNPVNLPECRPIENFWSILKGLVCKNNRHAQNLKKLRSRIKYCSNNVDIELIRSLAQFIPGLADKVRRNGLIENN